MTTQSTFSGQLRLLARKLNRRYHRKLGKWSYNKDGVDVFGLDWDNLLILDACRYDILREKFNHKYESFETVISRGSSTFEFLQGNVAGRDLHDTVYITANPVLYRHRDTLDGGVSFHDEINIWLDDGWNKKCGTVLPETVNEYVYDFKKKYPNKRLVVHYIQPHYPFVNSETTFDKGHLNDSNSVINFWKRATTGEIDLDPGEIWELYTENLNYVLPHVSKLANDLGGKSVITADHGNIFNECIFPIPTHDWGHPPGIYVNQLVNVPWVTVPHSNRREIFASEPAESNQSFDQDMVEDRLRDLGYVE